MCSLGGPDWFILASLVLHPPVGFWGDISSSLLHGSPHHALWGMLMGPAPQCVQSGWWEHEGECLWDRERKREREEKLILTSKLQIQPKKASWFQMFHHYPFNISVRPFSPLQTDQLPSENGTITNGWNSTIFPHDLSLLLLPMLWVWQRSLDLICISLVKWTQASPQAGGAMTKTNRTLRATHGITLSLMRMKGDADDSKLFQVTLLFQNTLFQRTSGHKKAKVNRLFERSTAQWLSGDSLGGLWEKTQCGVGKIRCVFKHKLNECMCAEWKYTQNK